MKDFYYILGTSSNSTAPEIDAAYQKLANKFGRGGEQDEFIDSHFREITEAYDVLRDAVRRRKYDAAFNRNQKKHLVVFKLKYLNIAVALTFLAVTLLFADYVVHVLQGHSVKTVVPKTDSSFAAAVLVHPKKYHRPVINSVKKSLLVPDTTTRPVTKIVPAPIVPIAADSTYNTTIHANITGIVYLHQSADYNSAILVKIPDAAQIRVLQKGEAYYKIMFDDQTGYVLKSSVGIKI